MAKVKFYQVGGSVRDELLGLKSKDLDYAVEAPSYDVMREAILERGGEIFVDTPKYLTIRAKVPELGACDFTLCRKDGLYHDGRHPDDVTVGTLLDDLARRDFTVNAIAKAEDGTLIDPYNGKDDLARGLLRCVGDTTTRFDEDGLRILRALRFGVTKNLTPSADIWAFLYIANLFAPRLKGVSIERVREELFRCFVFDTQKTLESFRTFWQLAAYLFKLDGGLWLKPTLEDR